MSSSWSRSPCTTASKGLVRSLPLSDTRLQHSHNSRSEHRLRSLRRDNWQFARLSRFSDLGPTVEIRAPNPPDSESLSCMEQDTSVHALQGDMEEFALRT